MLLDECVYAAKVVVDGLTGDLGGAVGDDGVVRCVGPGAEVVNEAMTLWVLMDVDDESVEVFVGLDWAALKRPFK